MSGSIRLDKWLWQARFFKTRTLSTKIVTAGRVRVNEAKVSKAAHAVRIGDALVFPQADQIRVVRIQALGERRGPATEAQALYEDLTPVSEPTPFVPDIPNNDRKGRPTKRDRRQIDAFTEPEA